MTDSKEQDRKTLSLGSAKPKLTLSGKPGDSGQVRQQFSHGRSKAVTVEVKRQRGGTNTALADGGAAARRAAEGGGQPGRSGRGGGGGAGARVLSQAEREARLRALQGAQREEEARRHLPPEAEQDLAGEAAEAVEVAPEPAQPLDPESLRRRELDELNAIEDEARRKVAEERFVLEEEQKRRDAERAAEDARRKAVADRSGQAAAARAPAELPNARVAATADDEEDTRRKTGGGGRGAPPGRGALPGRGAPAGPPRRAPGAG
jgi:translation initiation factor IF-2